MTEHISDDARARRGSGADGGRLFDFQVKVGRLFISLRDNVPAIRAFLAQWANEPR